MRPIFTALLVLMLPLSGIAKQPIGFKHWQKDDTTFVKQIGGAVRNYQTPEKAWDSIVNGFEIEGDSVVYVEKSVLRVEVNKNSGVSEVVLTWNDQEYTVTQKLLGIGWIKISTRQSQWIDSTMNWGNFSVDSNICKWTGISPAVDYRVRKRNGTVEHGIFYKAAFLDSAVILYDQRPDSLDIALANVMVYSLSANIDDHDSAVGDVPWRRLKDFGDYSFNLGKQRLRFPGSDTLPQIPVRQYWEPRGTKIICIEYVMMSHVKQVHEAYPTAVVWHNDTKKIEGTSNIDDATIRSNAPTYNTGGSVWIMVDGDEEGRGLVRVKNVASAIGEGATITGAVCSLNNYANQGTNDVAAYQIFKPHMEGVFNYTLCTDSGSSWLDWYCGDYEWTTAGCDCAGDDGSDNNTDNGSCGSSTRDRKATAEDTESVDAIGWFGWDMSQALAQGWYDETINEEGIILIADGTYYHYFYSTEEGVAYVFWVFTYTTAAAAGAFIMIQ